jgi:fatty-acyl-CoA synthase
MPVPTRHFAFWPPFLPRSLAVPQTTLPYNLEVSAHRYPDRPALVFYGSTITYRELLRDVDAMAAWLQHRCGLKRGDRVLLDFQNSPQYVIGYYAALRADGVVVPCNPMLRTDELAHLASDSGARIALCAQDVLPQFLPLLGSAIDRCVVGTYSDHLAAGANAPELVGAPRTWSPREGCDAWADAVAAGRAGELAPDPAQAEPGDVALLPYTSGTTGRPKGCIHTHLTLLANTAAHLAWSGFTSNAVFLGTMPLYHVTGMQGMMNAPIHAGASVVLLPRWDRDVAAELIERHRVTVWSCITTMMIDFLANPRLAQLDLSSLLRVGGGGAPMPDAVALQLKESLGLDYIEGYGLTETAAPITYNPQHRPKRQCAGVPLFDVDIRVLDLETGQECGPNRSGEIVLRGPQVFLGYWKQPEADLAAFVEHEGLRFFRTGDVGHFDDDGYLFVTDRVKRMINAAGLKVWPAEVEAMLYHHPGIQECCVISARDPRRGETVKALIVPRPSHRGQLTEASLIEWARERMAAYKVPRIVEFVEHLPRTASGKLLWRVLQDRENEAGRDTG